MEPQNNRGDQLMSAAVYEIRNRLHDDVTYIGSSVNVSKRFKTHRSQLLKGVHANSHMQRSWNKYGADAFEFSIIERVEDRDLLWPREQWHLDRARVRVFNVGKIIGQPTRGVPLSASTKAKIGDKNRGRKLSAEQIESLRAANLGRKATAETRAKMSASQTGRKCPKSTDHRRKISEGLKGHKLSAHQKASLRGIHLGRKNTPETIAKMSASHAGGISNHSTESKLKISATLKAFHAKRKSAVH